MSSPKRSDPPRDTDRSSWAVRIARVSGIPIRVHFTFLLFVIWFALSNVLGAGSLLVISLLAMFFCIVLHELGHSLVAQKFGYPVRDITLYPIGGVATIEGSPSPRHELLIALAGPAVNVVIAGILALILGPMHKLPHWSWPPWSSPENALLLQRSPTAFLFIANLSVVAFNMIPAFPMDGGRVLRAGLGLIIGKGRATQVAAAVGQLLAILMGIYGAGLLGASPNYGLCIIALFVYFGAGQERRIEEVSEVAGDVPVRDAMVRDFVTLSFGDTLQHAADRLLAGTQQDFPVLAGDDIAGVLSRTQLLHGLARHGPGALIAAEMTRDPVVAGPDDLLESCLFRQDGVNRAPILVRDGDGRLVGMLTVDNLMEYFTLRRLAEERENV